MKTSNAQIDVDIPQGFCAGKQSMHLDRFGPASDVVAAPLPAVEPLLDCAAAAVVLGGLHPKTVERWAREGRHPPIIISGIGNSALLSWKSGCSLM